MGVDSSHVSEASSFSETKEVASVEPKLGGGTRASKKGGSKRLVEHQGVIGAAGSGPVGGGGNWRKARELRVPL